jgi:hypothetical protein
MPNFKPAKILGALIAVMLSGCSHAAMRGNVAMKVGDQDAHVCLGDNEVKVGDRIAAFKNECPIDGPSARRGGNIAQSRLCSRVKVGEGSVIELLNEHYSVVRFDPGVSFEEGTLVEKIK